MQPFFALVRRFAAWWWRTTHPAYRFPVEDDCGACDDQVLVAHLAGRLMFGFPGKTRTQWYLIPTICDADVTLPGGEIVGLVKPVVRFEDARRK